MYCPKEIDVVYSSDMLNSFYCFNVSFDITGDASIEIVFNIKTGEYEYIARWSKEIYKTSLENIWENFE